MAAPDPKALAGARALLKKGDVDGAVREFVAGEAHEEASRALAGAKRFVEAAELLLNTLGVRANELSKIRDPVLRSRAAHAAALLRQGGFNRAADEIEDQIEGTAQRFGPAPEERTVRAEGAAAQADEKTQIGRPAYLDLPTPSHISPPPDTRPQLPVSRSSTGPAILVAPQDSHLGDMPTRAPQQRPGPPKPKSSASSARPGSAGARAASPHEDEAGPQPGFEPGAIIADRYELGPCIGRGGMARVYRAKDQELGQDIAIKVFDRMDDATLLARFKQELLSSRQIAHPNVVRLFDIGTFAEHKYLTMELLVGQDLKDRLMQPIAVSESLDLLIQCCRGLEAAHAVGVIHRDVKPQNLFITTQRVLKIMDFGIAKLQAAAKLTSPGMGVGTPEFMAPEQILDSSKVSAATDLYAIGVTAYRMCTGRVPFQDKDMLKLLKKQLKEDPPRPREVNPRLPEKLEAIILKLLQKDPAARYQRAAEVAEAFTTVRKMFAAPSSVAT